MCRIPGSTGRVAVLLWNSSIIIRKCTNSCGMFWHGRICPVIRQAFDFPLCSFSPEEFFFVTFQFFLCRMHAQQDMNWQVRRFYASTHALNETNLRSEGAVKGTCPRGERGARANHGPECWNRSKRPGWVRVSPVMCFGSFMEGTCRLKRSWELAKEH